MSNSKDHEEMEGRLTKLDHQSNRPVHLSTFMSAAVDVIRGVMLRSSGIEQYDIYSNLPILFPGFSRKSPHPSVLWSKKAAKGGGHRIQSAYSEML